MRVVLTLGWNVKAETEPHRRTTTDAVAMSTREIIACYYGAAVKGMALPIKFSFVLVSHEDFCELWEIMGLVPANLRKTIQLKWISIGTYIENISLKNSTNEIWIFSYELLEIYDIFVVWEQKVSLRYFQKRKSHYFLITEWLRRLSSWWRVHRRNYDVNQQMSPEFLNVLPDYFLYQIPNLSL